MSDAVPAISVVIPAYNAERHIAETITAVLRQSRPADEVIVVNDGSTDRTLEELRQFRGEIRVITQRNQGAAAAHNTGFGAARGDYVARCDADDIWHPTKLERQLDAVIADPRIDIAVTAARVFGEVDRAFADFAGGIAPAAGIVSDAHAFAQSLYRANMICASSALIRLDLQRRLGPFAPLKNEDYEFWLRAIEAGALFFYDHAELVYYRRHQGSVSTNVAAMYDDAYAVHMRYRGLAGGRARARRVLAADRFHAAQALWGGGDVTAARRRLLSALLWWPAPQKVAWAVVLAAPWRWRSELVRLLQAARGSGARARRRRDTACGRLAD